MDEVDPPEQKELELELTERDTVIATLRQEVLDLKARLGDDEAKPSSSSTSPLPPSSSPPLSPDQAEVVQLLRTSLSETAADRDDLLQALAITRSEQATLQARLSDLEEENEMLLMSRLNSSKAFEEEKEKRVAGEETIAMLRSTVEEARKGLMRLQTEKSFKRTSSNPAAGSAASGGLGVDGLPQSGGGSNPPSSFFSTSTPPPTSSTITSKRDKRASLNVGYGLVPSGRTGNSHRRVSSISDSAIPSNPSFDPTSSSSLTPAPTNKAGLRELRLTGPPPPSGGIGSFLGFGGGGAAAASTGLDGRRVSQLSVPASPSKAPIDLTSDHSDGGGSDAGAIEAGRLAAMRKLEGIPASPVVDPEEMVALRAQMGALQLELVKAREAREASESACRALREFIAFSSRANEAAVAGGDMSEGGAGGFGNGAGVEGGMLLPPLPSDMEDAEEDHTRRASASPPPPPTSARTWSMGGLFRKDSKVPTPDPSLVTPIASPNPLVSPQLQDQDSPAAGSTAFVSSWSKSVSQSGPMSPSPLTIIAPVAASPPRPPPKSKFSFFSSKSLAQPTQIPTEEVSPLSSPLPPPAPSPHGEDEPPLVPSKSEPESKPTSSTPPRVASPTPPTPTPTSPVIPEVITTLPSTPSHLSSPPPPSIPEGSEEIEPLSGDITEAEEEVREKEEVSLKD